jgi:hypothetical protein
MSRRKHITAKQQRETRRRHRQARKEAARLLRLSKARGRGRR